MLIDEPSKHFPDRIEIELHIDADNPGARRFAADAGKRWPRYLPGVKLASS